MRMWLKRMNIGFLLLSLVLAVMFWLYVSIVQDNEIDYSLTLRPTFEGEDALRDEREILVTGGMNTELDIKLRGKRSDLALCNEDTVQVIASLYGVNDTGTQDIRYTIRLPDEVASRVRVTWKSKELLTITTDKIENNPFDVRAERGNIKLPDGYKLDDVQIDPGQIKVRGPSEQLRKIAKVYVAPTREDVDRTVSFPMEVTLEDEAGQRITDLTCDPPSVMVTLVVSRIKEVDLRVDLAEGGGAQAKNVQLTIEPSSIWLTGDPAVLDGLNAITLGSIDLASTKDGDTFPFDIQLPNDVTGMDSDAKLEAKVTVRLVGLATKQFDVTNITYTGAPEEGYAVNMITQSLSVTLRGPRADIERVEPFNIRAVADLTGFSLAPGPQDWPVTVYVDGFPEVGAIHEPDTDIKVTLEMVENTPATP